MTSPQRESDLAAVVKGRRMTPKKFLVVYHLPSGIWSAGSYATPAEAHDVALRDQARTGWKHRVVEAP